MPSKWPSDITFTEIILSVTEKTCRQCGNDLAICSHREHRILMVRRGGETYLQTGSLL
jgi:hypothetical protein